MAKEMVKELTLTELQKQIAELQAKAQAIIETEKASVIEEMKEKISQYNITFEELGFKAPAIQVVAETEKTKKNSNAGKSTAPKIPKYKNPATGQTWHGGKGAAPLWVTQLADKHLEDKKEKNKDGNMVVPREILTKWLDDNGYKLPEPVAEPAQATQEEAK